MSLQQWFSSCGTQPLWGTHQISCYQVFPLQFLIVADWVTEFLQGWGSTVSECLWAVFKTLVDEWWTTRESWPLVEEEPIN
ncbi:hypothetical protein I79_023204 [Cricetulus griseus]|uniref:Uncharacterized protein n=1 Tax=Cricetulus griseus TaxID=10029 RepID=G3IHB6_CRIGR|nr:hypothetical protein I79_023204 [Cricetulus griseus]